MPRSGGFWAFPVVLALALLVSGWAIQPPPPRPSSTTGAGVSLPRALGDLSVITKTTHVTGSPGSARVRDFLIARFAQMGLTAEIQRGFGIRQSPREGHAIAIAPDENIVAVLPGRDRSAPAVVVMAHYDAVPFSFGASDDGAGTVAVLETARALSAGPQPRRDVIFLLTDGEELGLTGAQLFFDQHPLARHVGIVVNAEARGSRGRAVMFQTSPGNAALVDLWAGAAISPTGNSLSDAIYKLLPNDTDLSVSLDKGIAGINAAYIDGFFDYHSPTDAFDTIDRGTLQHLGDFALTTTRALAFAPQLPERTRSATYFDVFGRGVVRYPPWLGWLPLLLAAAGLVALMRRPGAITPLAVIGGMAGTVALTLVVAGAMHVWNGTVYAGGAIPFRENQAETGLMLWGYAALALAAVLLARPRAAMTQGAILLMILAGTALQIVLPGAAFVFAWPAAIAVAIALALDRWGGGSTIGRSAVILVSALVLAWIFILIQFLYVSVGTMSAGVVALALPFIVAFCAPVLDRWSADRSGRMAGLVLVAAAGGWAIWLWQTDGFSARQPRSGDFRALENADDGTRFWATTSGAAELPAGPSEPFSFAPIIRQGLTVQPAAMAAFASDTRPAFRAIERPGGGDVRVTTAANPRRLILALRPSAALTGAALNGKSVRLAAGEWTLVYYGAQRPADLELSYTAPTAGTRIDVRYLLATPGLPANAPRDGGAPSNWTLLSGTRTVVGSWTTGAVPDTAARP